MFSVLPNSIIVKSVKYVIAIIALVFGTIISFASSLTQSPQVIDNNLYVTKTMHVGQTPASMSFVSGAVLNVNGIMASGRLALGPWPHSPDNYVFFGTGTLPHTDSANYALLQRVNGNEIGRTFLNSPVDIRFRIRNADKMILGNNGTLHLGRGIENTKAGGVSFRMFADDDTDLSLVRGGGSVFIGFGEAENKRSNRLSVNGSASISNRLEVGAHVLAQGFTETSDIKLKTNIQPLENSLDKLQQIRGVSFEWNDESGKLAYRKGMKDTGLIAQDVESVFPEFVITGEDGYKAINYGKLTTVLIESVKELKAMNEQLNSRIKNLEQQLL